MIRIRAQIAVTGLVVVLGALPACSSEDDPMDSGDDGDDSGDDGGDDDGDDGAGGPEISFVVNSIDTNTKITGLTVQLFNPETGDLYDGMEAVSGAGGRVEFDNPPDPVGYVVRSGSAGGQVWSDTWNFEPGKKGEEDLIRVSAGLSATLVPMVAQYENDPAASALAGNVLWHNPETDEDELVGCATVEAEGAEDIRYFVDSLPTSTANRALTAGTQPPDGDPAYPDNAGEAGKWFIANLASGKRTVTASVGGEVVGEAEFFIIPRTEGTEFDPGTGPLNSNVHLGNIFVNEDITENPTPANCM